MSNGERGAEGRFGTLGGVFTPCVLTILGVIMFLRFGEVVANAGVAFTLAIVLAAKVITVLTGLSLAAIATNTRTKGGGAYFLISRSLGVEFGGTIGLVFFLAQAISVAMYVVGFAEAFVWAFPEAGWSRTEVATISNAVVFLCVYIGAGWTIRLQFAILGLLLLSLVSFVVGAFGDVSAELLDANMAPSWQAGQSWITMFALFFPAVTGIMAGANLSGDLRDPARSIPKGTLAAIAFTAVIYLGLAVLLGAVRPRQRLLDENLIMQEVAAWPFLITAGVFAATLSSALGSMMGAPRILQAFARDRVFPILRPFAAGRGAGAEPRRATVLTFFIAQACVMAGDLNAIAPVITMAFMITYGILNLATFYEAFTRNPSYRPRFRWCHWSMSLAGAVLCGVVMFLISWTWAAVAIAAMLGIYWLISEREIEASWGDLRSGLAFERVRRNLAVLEDQLYHPKNWRPILLTMSGAADHRRHLAVYGHWLTAGHGLQTLGLVIEGDIGEMLRRRANQRDVLRSFIREESLSAFPAVVVADSIKDGIVSLVQAHGLGGLEPNTVLLGWPTQPDRGPEFCGLLRTLAGLDRSIIIAKSALADESIWDAPAGTIDVWWRGRSNGPLMVLLAHLVSKNHGWRNRAIRLLRIVPNEAAQEDVRRHLTDLVVKARIDAETASFVGNDSATIIQRESKGAALTFLGFEPPATPDEDLEFLQSLEHLTRELPRVVLVDSAGGMELES